MKEGTELLNFYESNDEVDKMAIFISDLNLDFSLVPGELNYHDPVSILVDATLSINRPYKKFVVPRVEKVKEYNLNSLDELGQMIENIGVEEMNDFWNYKHRERVIILRNLVKKFLDFKNDYQMDDDMKVLYKWGDEARVEDWKSFGVKGIGFTTFQYLRILCGAETVKPDIHIKRAVEAAVGHSVPLERVVSIVESTAKKMDLSARRLDYALWSFYSKKS